jgi:hypothetical protein
MIGKGMMGRGLMKDCDGEGNYGRGMKGWE